MNEVKVHCTAYFLNYQQTLPVFLILTDREKILVAIEMQPTRIKGRRRFTDYLGVNQFKITSGIFTENGLQKH